MLLRITFFVSIVLFFTPAFAGNWGGYVSHEGWSEAEACHEARKHASALCEQNGEFFHIYDNAGTCKLVKSAKYKNKTLYYVNLIFTCHEKEAKDIPGH